MPLKNVFSKSACTSSHQVLAVARGEDTGQGIDSSPKTFLILYLYFIEHTYNKLAVDMMEIAKNAGLIVNIEKNFDVIDIEFLDPVYS